MFDDGHKINITPLTADNFSPKDLIPFERKYKQIQSESQKTIENSSALLNNADIHSDDDDDIVEKGILTQVELQ